MTDPTRVRPNAAIDYVAESFDTGGEKIVGRQSANAAFLKAFAQHGGVDPLYCFSRTEAEFQALRQQMGASASNAGVSAEWIPFARPELLRKAGCLFRPGPIVAMRAWTRRHLGERSYSICGMTHTICTSQVMDAIGSFLVAPLHSWDAVVCTSAVARRVIEHVLDEWSEYLACWLDARPRRRLRLPVIPLGVDCDAFAAQAQTAGRRETLRAELGIAPDDVAILYAGRLSYHDKAHPMPMYLALEEAARRTGRRLHLIQAGRSWTDQIGERIAAAARRNCPTVNVIFLDDTHRPELWKQVWCIADVFTSLADNIQETFGLTPTEAMAAGLPVVVSDWNGYRETVRDGIDGFRIPTMMPPGGTGVDIAVRHSREIDAYPRYVAHVSQCTAVDVGRCTDAYVQLIERPELRRTMGESGRRRARECYDWPIVIRAYQELWRELEECRTGGQASSLPASGRNGQRPSISPAAIQSSLGQAGIESSFGQAGSLPCVEEPVWQPGRPPNPLREDPFALFACYATEALDGEQILTAVPGAAKRLDVRYASPFANYAGAPFLLASRDECRAVLAQLEQGPCPVSAVLDRFDAARHHVIHRTLGWMLKMHLAEIVRDSAAANSATIAPSTIIVGPALRK